MASISLPCDDEPVQGGIEREMAGDLPGRLPGADGLDRELDGPRAVVLVPGADLGYDPAGQLVAAGAMADDPDFVQLATICGAPGRAKGQVGEIALLGHCHATPGELGLDQAAVDGRLLYGHP